MLFKALSCYYMEQKRDQVWILMVFIVYCADIAAKMGCRDVSNLSPTAIALEVSPYSHFSFRFLAIKQKIRKAKKVYGIC